MLITDPKELESFRQQGDPLADDLVSELLDSKEGWADEQALWNTLLDLIDEVEQAPELLLVEESDLYRQWKALPGKLRNWFDPQLTPDWLTRDHLKQLEASQKLWQSCSLAIIAALYGSSLPYCYLIERGIPALYNSGRLLNSDTIFQRIYETGRMIQHVCDGGLSVVSDQRRQQAERLKQAESKAKHAEGTEQANDALQEAMKSYNRHDDGDEAHQHQPNRYIWGTVASCCSQSAGTARNHAANVFTWHCQQTIRFWQRGSAFHGSSISCC